MDPATLCAEARASGVVSVVADALAGCPDLPADLNAALRSEAARMAAIDLIQEREIRWLVAALDRAAAGALLMKGAELAYTHYARPDLRPRSDTDLLISHARLQTVRSVLGDLGYEHAGHIDAAMVMGQASFVKRRDETVLHMVDVHWRLANPRVFAGLMSYEELAASARQVPKLGPEARGLGDAHALLLACVHRVAHHFDSDRLIWLYDIRLLAASLDEAAWTEFVRLAVDRGVASICLRGLEKTMDILGMAVPSMVLSALGDRARRQDEMSASYLKPGSRAHQEIHVFATDLRALPTWADRWRLVREHVFPSPAYMRDVYAPSSRAPLSILYARRALRGARKWLARA
jgi:hypothetical protein